MSDTNNLSAFQKKAQESKVQQPITIQRGTETQNQNVSPPPKKAIAKKKKIKSVKDTFSFPENDHDLIESLVNACLKKGVKANKSEIVRAGLHALSELSGSDLINIVNKVERVQPGRPKER